MNRWILAATLLFAYGCGVQAENTASTYTATVVENSEDEVVLEIEDEKIQSIDNRTDLPSACSRITLHEHDRVLILDENETIGFGELKKSEQVTVTFDHGGTVVRTDQGSSDTEAAENRSDGETADVNPSQN